LLFEKIIWNAPLQICFSKKQSAMKRCRREISKKHVQSKKQICNEALHVCFSKKSFAMEHCRFVFRKADVQWSISRDSARKTLRKGSVHVSFCRKSLEAQDLYATSVEASRRFTIRQKVATAFAFFAKKSSKKPRLFKGGG
jgi:hypothetical protein